MGTFFGALRADHPGKGLKWVSGFVQSCMWSSRCICAPADASVVQQMHLCSSRCICGPADAFVLQQMHLCSSRCICAPADMHLHLCLKAIQRICIYDSIFNLQSIVSGFWVCICTLLHTYIANANAHIWKYNLQYMHTHVHIQKYANMQVCSCICNQSIGCGQIIQKSIL